MRRLSNVFLCVFITSVIFVPVQPALAIDVTGNNDTDQFIGTGSDQGQQSGAGSSGSNHACAHCQWMLGDPCSSAFNEFGCGTVTDGCPAGQEQRRQWFSSDDGLTWEDRGLTCFGGSAKAIDPGGVELHAAFERSVPPASITWQPKAGILPQVPVLFDSGQPQELPASNHGLGSATVSLAPTARWHWDFGDGGTLDTSQAASRYPDTAVSHVYRRSGTFEVTLTTTWSATFTVNGQGPYVVDGEISQDRIRQITVGQGRAVLTPGH